MRILILEDSQPKLQAISTVILSTGHVESNSIDTCADALTAFNKLTDNYYDVFVVDVRVPERLGQGPSRDGGKKLVDDVCFSENSCNVPGRIIGLTEFEEIAHEMEADFKMNGVVLLHYDDSSDVWKESLVTQVRQVVRSTEAERVNGRNFGSYLGIVCALDVEFEAVQRLPWNFTDHKEIGDPTLYIKGHFQQGTKTRSVIAALCPRMGMSAAAVTSTKLIEAFRPEFLAMTGITGAVRGKANLGDVIIAEECWDWGMGKWVRREEKSVFLPGPHHLSLDSDLRSAAYRLSKRSSELARIRDEYQSEKPGTALSIILGPIASGSAVISDQEMTEQISTHHRKLVGIEMESYGLYSAAFEASNPRPKVISIKAASDFADDQKNDNYRYYCSYTSAQVLKSLAELELN